jgi:hypothetical protein
MHTKVFGDLKIILTIGLLFIFLSACTSSNSSANPQITDIVIDSNLSPEPSDNSSPILLTESLITPTPNEPYKEITKPPNSEMDESLPLFNRDCYEDPRLALDDFLHYLYDGNFDQAASIYSNPYPFERAHINPDELIPQEKNQLVKAFLSEHCLGYDTCLKHEIVAENIISNVEVQYDVRFFLEDRSVLSISTGPVSSGDYTIFEFRVIKVDGCFLNLDIPPMTP